MILLDSSVLMTAHHNYYPIDRVPEYWDWLLHQFTTGKAKIPLEIYEEIKDGPDDEDDLLFEWISRENVKRVMILAEEVDMRLFQRVVETGYAPDLTDKEVEELGRDPFLIAYGLVNPVGRAVSTAEVSKPRRLRQNRHVPDVCRDFEIRCIDQFAFGRELDFSTKWNRG